MACKEKENLLHGYFDGELDLMSSLAFEEHVKTCPDCAQELRSQRTLRESLHSSGLYDRAPDQLEVRIRASIPGSSKQVAEIELAGKRRRWEYWLGIAAAIAVVVVASLALVNSMRSEKSENLIAQEVVESHVRSLQLGHLTDVPSSDQHTVKPWFNGKIDFAPPVTDFAAHGFPLVGGRLDYLDHHNVASLVYQRRAHFINVFIWPDETKTNQLPQTETIDGYHLIHWQQDGLNFWMISDVGQDDENQLVALIRQ